jgi:uncharacterized membrane protein
MDLYTVFKFLHIAAAICWVGGGVTMFALAMFARNDAAMQGRVVDHVAFMAVRWFVPMSVATVVFGVIMATMGGLWGDAWIVLGLLGFVATFCTGNFALKPLTEQVAALNAEGRSAEAQAVGARVLDVSKFDYVMLFSVIALMVLKPGFGDVVVLGVLAVVVALGAALFLPRAFGGGTPEAA